MRRYRRMVVSDRLIPFLAAGVGLLALAGAVIVQTNAEARSRAVLAELGKVQASIAALGQRADALAAADDDGTAAGLLALQSRMDKLEADWKTRAESPAAAVPAPAAAPGLAQAASTEIDPSAPTTDCIPVGTRFMVTPNETYPICQVATPLKVGAIAADTVDIVGAGVIAETGFGTLVGTKCTVMVFSADAAGFAEVRVTCL